MYRLQTSVISCNSATCNLPDVEPEWSHHTLKRTQLFVHLYHKVLLYWNVLHDSAAGGSAEHKAPTATDVCSWTACNKEAF